MTELLPLWDRTIMRGTLSVGVSALIFGQIPKYVYYPSPKQSLWQQMAFLWLLIFIFSVSPRLYVFGELDKADEIASCFKIQLPIVWTKWIDTSPKTIYFTLACQQPSQEKAASLITIQIVLHALNYLSRYQVNICVRYFYLYTILAEST